MTATFRRVPRWAWITALFVVGGVVAAVAAAALVDKGTATYASPGDNVLISADGRTLSSSRGGGCGPLVPEAQETATTVSLRLRTYPSAMTAPGSCAMTSYSVTLHAPLGTRTLIDGVTHRVLYRFDAREILRPAWLPEGYVHRYDTATLAEETVAGSRGGCVQLYTRGDGYDEEIYISQDTGATWHAPDDAPTAEPVTVRGHQGLAIPGEIAWNEGGELVTIRSLTYAYATPDTATLVAIADSMRSVAAS